MTVRWSSSPRTLLLALLGIVAGARGLAAQSLSFRIEPMEDHGPLAVALVRPPDLLNRAEIEQSMRMLYPQDFYRQHVAVNLVVSFTVDSTGRVDPRSIVVLKSTHPWFKAAAVALVREFRLAPATMDVDGVQQPVPIRVIMPLSWTTTGVQEL